jgi:HB1, ASXL, restriction endonuclease HTH domain
MRSRKPSWPRRRGPDVEVLEAAFTVLREEARPLHWTVIQDLALKRGYLDPFIQRNIRQDLIASLSNAARTGTLIREGKGVYRLP